MQAVVKHAVAGSSKACSKVGRCAGMCTGMQVSAVSMSVKSQGKSLTRGRESIEINRRIGSLGA